MSDFRREIPGLTPVAWREYRYISDDGRDKFVGNGLFDKVTGKVEPLIPKSGGAMVENCKLWLPSGELFHALSYKGDIEGWRKQIEQGAIQMGLFIGEIVGDKIVLSDGRSYEISACTFEMY
ncbi:hypothetical protein KP22_18345 [Pectobacterium betavasculorum]|uniref:Uncharacterized protein n=1 Tax=Pectobacterium betavasculorum TaxID=55207 RepID=A0A093RPR9_9GAMM|nr:hypothetical protein [Pectobacterium betavasculorum]KFX02454.1 hypothetical protein KP22_18345 [Pectobacterium betavasculorum]